MVDDAPRIASLVQSLGTLFLDLMTRLDKEKMGPNFPSPLDPPEKGGPIKHIGLLIGNMCLLADTSEQLEDCIEPEATAWKWEILRMARRRGIRVVRVVDGVEEYRYDEDEYNKYVEGHPEAEVEAGKEHKLSEELDFLEQVSYLRL